MKRFFWFVAFTLLAALVAAGYWFSPTVLMRFHRDVAADIDGSVITLTDLQQALRDDLWRQGQTWEALDAAAQSQARQATLERLISARLVRHYRESSHFTAPTISAQGELTMWRKQFQEEAEGTQRLTLQQQTEPSLENGMLADQLDQAWIDQQIAHKTALLPDAAEAWYRLHSEEVRVPVAYRAAHIYLTRHDKLKPDREPEIRAIYQMLTYSKTTFAQLAAQYSDDDRSKLRGGDLDWFTAKRMPADFIAAVDRLVVGQTSQPVPTALGWHIIQLTDRKASFIPAFEDVRSEIEASLQNQKRDSAIRDLQQNLRQKAEQEGLLHLHPERIGSVAPAAR